MPGIDLNLDVFEKAIHMSAVGLQQGQTRAGAWGERHR